MKKIQSNKSSKPSSDDMRAEYHFDYEKARPNRFADKIYKDRLTVVLDPDVAKIFTTSESVNTILRALVTALPKRNKAKTVRKPLAK